jgi:hypothetical protein
VADPTPEQIRADAERRVRAALDHVERSERELEAACQVLSPVIGALPDWERIGKLSIRVHAAWTHLHEVKPRAGYRLDDAGIRALAKRLSEEARHA